MYAQSNAVGFISQKLDSIRGGPSTNPSRIQLEDQGQPLPSHENEPHLNSKRLTESFIPNDGVGVNDVNIGLAGRGIGDTR